MKKRKRKVKKCNGCDITKPVSKFFLKRKKNGLSQRAFIKHMFFPILYVRIVQEYS